ncbi:hypothetical protein K7X08_031932 [Anisodus acutangulus]|uniref:Uncharacterized protein n=1 Tax=Anisodus acutangulus TaxID=402998 RepID=A0A9Q1RMK6_9SOLA|nr:hypothetical protein K7X08_031932 [Anisodus acutangulus]
MTVFRSVFIILLVVVVSLVRLHSVIRFSPFPPIWSSPNIGERRHTDREENNSVTHSFSFKVFNFLPRVFNGDLAFIFCFRFIFIFNSQLQHIKQKRWKGHNL